MADVDIFTINVQRNWCYQTRAMFRAPDDSDAILKLTIPLSEDINQGGCPGLLEICRIFVKALEYGDTSRRPFNDIQRIVRLKANTRTTVLADVSRRLLLKKEAIDCSGGKERLVQEFLIAWTNRQMLPGALSRRLATDREWQDFSVPTLQRQVRAILEKSDEIKTISTALLESEEGEWVTRPRFQRSHYTNEQLASLNLLS